MTASPRADSLDAGRARAGRQRWWPVLLALATSACATLPPAQYQRAEAVAAAARETALTCPREAPDACAAPSPLRDLALQAASLDALAASSLSAAGPDMAADTGLAGTGPAHADAQAPAAPSPTAPDAETAAPGASAPEAGASAPAPPEAAQTATADGTGAPRLPPPPAPDPDPLHYALILDYGQDALLARLDLIRGAQRSIDVQTYIFDEDDAGHLVLDELLAAARRGVRVRILVDQLAALRRVDTLAALAAAHVNFEMRLYNPVLGKGRFSYPMYAWATVCCFTRLNQRMHNKLMLVDGLVAIVGGRNYQDDYYDWDPRYNFRDRDVLIAGPVAADMGENFQDYWDAPLSTRLPKLSDVGRLLLRQGAPPVQHPDPVQPLRLEAIRRDAADTALIRTRLADAALLVRGVSFIGDVPKDKHHDANEDGGASSAVLRDLIAAAEREVLLQTPYLVMSKPAQRLFRELQAREDRADRPRVRVSTNSLAATDAFIPYALSYKYKRRYLRDLKFEIHEFKPFPENAPIDLEATGALQFEQREDGSIAVFGSGGEGERNRPLSREYLALRYSSRGANQPVPLDRAGVRFGLHAKSMVIDDRVGVIGTHNFDPRGENYNTETVVIVRDAAFARALAASIERDMAPENAWTIAPRIRSRYFGGLEYSLAKVSEYLPVFDFWPVRYATSYEFVPGPDCPQPISPRASDFHRCYRPVGDFPEVGVVIRPLTRIFTAFGAGLAPIL